MSVVFVTGGTGFLGGYTVAELLNNDPDVQLRLMTRAKTREQAVEKLWRGLQLHMDGEAFYRHLERVEFVLGDLHADGLGFAPDVRKKLVGEVDSILHIAASLNRKSAKACLNSNLRGTLSVIQLAREIQDGRGLRRFSHVSTVAVCGHRDKEVVLEDESIDFNRSDYDPYGRTKKFCEHMVRELLPDVQKTFFRPSIVMGDSRFGETTQFDMVRAFCVIADLPLIPLRDDDRLDIVNADWVGHAIATLHMKPTPDHMIYHLASGTSSLTTGVIARAMAGALGRKPRFAPWLMPSFESLVNTVGSSRRKNPVTLIGSLLKVFLPYITYDTVFDNSRAVTELGRAPVPFDQYCGELYRFAKKVGYEFPYAPMPKRPATTDTEAAA